MPQGAEPEQQPQRIERDDGAGWPQPENDPRKIDYRQLGAAPAFIENARKKRRLMKFLRGAAGFAGRAVVKKEALLIVGFVAYVVGVLSLVLTFLFLQVSTDDTLHYVANPLTPYSDFSFSVFALAVFVFDVCMIINGKFYWLAYQFLWALGNVIAASLIGALFNFHRLYELFTEKDAPPMLGALLWCWTGVIVVGFLLWKNIAVFLQIEDDHAPVKYEQYTNAPPAAAPVAPPKDVLD